MSVVVIDERTYESDRLTETGAPGCKLPYYQDMHFLPPTWADSLPSTNTALLDQLASGIVLPHGMVLATDDQTAGRGQGARQWQAAPGQDLACSFVLHAAVDTPRLCSLSMAVALGVADLLDGLGLRAATKWPNDVLAGDSKRAKICGILAELSPKKRGSTAVPVVIVGVGLNVGMTASAAAAIDQPATSVRIETGRVMAPRALLPGLLQALAPRLDSWLADGFAGLQADWENRCIGLGEPVTIVEATRERHGVLAGFGDAGQLLLTEERPNGDGATVEIWTGRLRLPKI